MGSTGHIVSDLHDIILLNGDKCYVVSGYAMDHNADDLYCVNEGADAFQIRKDILISRLTGKMGYRYRGRTKETMNWIDSKRPDLIHLHNIHGDWLHVQTLFDYVKETQVPVVWTLHDCWGFTGRCSHFENCGCQKWRVSAGKLQPLRKSQVSDSIQEGCYGCKNKKVYPITYFFDWSKDMWRDKKTWFSGIKNMTIVTPSEWLKGYVGESLLGCYDCQVIRNGIDLSVFCPSKKEKRNQKKIILGVASSWNERKGLDDFYRLDERIDHERYQIVIIGLNQHQMKQIPPTIMGISRTNNVEELVQWYSMADVFVNPTYQDNYPTVNLEAIACGTPVVTYQTGGSPESVGSEVGIVVRKGDLEELYRAVIRVCDESLYSSESCTSYAKDNFSKQDRYREYLDLYRKAAG